MRELREPFIGPAMCMDNDCLHQWEACAPHGVADADAVECPKCGKKTGKLLT